MVEVLSARAMSSEAFPASLGASGLSSHQPFSLECFVEDGRGVLREAANVRRVQDLFSVSCFFQPHHSGRGELVRLGGGSKEEIEKARCYLQAMCCPAMHFDLQCDWAGDRLVHMLFRQQGRLHDNLERQFLTRITHLTTRDHHNVIRVQGRAEDVDRIKLRLQGMLDSISIAPEGHSHPHAPPPPPSSSGHTLSQPHPSLTPRSSDSAKESYYINELRYPSEVVRRTLTSLGPMASEEDIMNRLNQLMKGVTLSPHPLEEAVPKGLNPAAPLVKPVVVDPKKLRPIVIDGSNVAMRHGNGRVFSCRGIQLAVDYFKARGHTHIKVFVPEWRKEQSRPDSPIIDQHVLTSLEALNMLSFTPCRKVAGKRIVCYDDRYIIRYAELEEGVVVSNDHYRDLMQESTKWKRIIEERLLQFAFANDHFMPPDDPLGKNGPSLDQFIRFDRSAPKRSLGDASGGSSSQKVCPHLGNCTFGRKCKYYHPDREPPQTKVEHVTGSGSSGGSYTPSTISSPRSTPSPSPDSRSLHSSGLHSSKSSREDLHNRYNSSDDLGSSSSPYLGGGSSPFSPPSGGGKGGIDISELSTKLEQGGYNTSPTKGSSYQPRPSHTGPQLSIRFSNTDPPRHMHSAPVHETTPSGHVVVHSGSVRNHTFPISQVGVHRPEDQFSKSRYPSGGSYGSSSSSHHHDQYLSPVHTSQGQYGSTIQYTSQPPSQQGGDYTRGRVGPSAANYSSQSIPLSTLYQQQQSHFSPGHQPHPLTHAPPAQTSLPTIYPTETYGIPRAGGEGFSAPSSAQSRQELYRAVVSVLRGCEDRVSRVMQRHPELVSLSDLHHLVELVKSD